jgi:hypothetical protein
MFSHYNLPNRPADQHKEHCGFAKIGRIGEI